MAPAKQNRDNATDGLATVTVTSLTKDSGFKGQANHLDRYWRDWSFYFTILCALAIAVPTLVYAWPHLWTDISYGNQRAYSIAMIVITSTVATYHFLSGILFLVNPSIRNFSHQYRTVFMITTLTMFGSCVLLLAPFITFIVSFKHVDITLVAVFFRWGLLALANVCIGFIYCGAFLYHMMLFWYPTMQVEIITEESCVEILKALRNKV